MKGVRIASQMDAALNAAFVEHWPAVEITPIGPGAPQGLDPAISILFARPLARAGEPLPERPQGWPFGLKWTQCVSVGSDAYPDWFFDGPVVSSGRGWSAPALAEFAMASIFAAAKRFPETWISSPRAWRPQALGKVAGETLGLYGFGSIAQALTPMARALGMKMLATRRSAAPLPAGVERASGLSDLVRRSRFLVLAAPLTAETRGALNDEALRDARGLHVINLARGALIDDIALLGALGDGRVASAFLDTTQPEPLPEDHPFYSHPRVRISPHTAVFTPDMQDRILEKFSANFDRFRQGIPPHDIIRAGLGD